MDQHRHDRPPGSPHTLLDHPELWRAGQLNHTPETVPSGHAVLDEHLPGGGWPRAGLTELLLDTAGVGELRLLVPLLRTLSHEQNRWLAWIAPPFVPYAPALEAAGVDISKVLLIHPKTHQEALWAAERASRSGTCSLVLAWLDEAQLKLTDTRRLQLAARQGRTLGCLFRPTMAAGSNSLAELRLQVAPGTRAGTVNVNILKRRGGWPVQGLEALLNQDPQPAEIREQLSLWREQQRHWPILEASPETDDAAAGLPEGVLPVPEAPDRSTTRVLH